MSQKVMKQICEAAFFAPLGLTFGQTERQWGLPVILDGPPGGAKSSYWWSFARTWLVREGGRIAFSSITPGAQGEGRFGVVPVPHQAGAKKSDPMTLVFPPPDDLMRDFAEGVGMLLWDDLTTLRDDLAAVALDGLQMRRIGTHYLGNRVRCVGGTNAIKDAAGGMDLPFAVENRALWLKWEDPSGAELGDYLLHEADVGLAQLMGTPFALEAEEKRVLELWPAAYTEAASYVARYLERNTLAVRGAVPLRTDDVAGRAAATPRTWEYATRMLASTRLRGLPIATQNVAVAAAIGPGITNELFQFIRANDLPSPRDVLDRRVDLSKLKLDVLHMSLSSTMQFVSVEKSQDDIDKLWLACGTLAESKLDLVAVMLRKAEKLGLLTTLSPAASKMLIRLSEMVGAGVKK